ncbi:hypothetical protein [Streptomyces sp. SLBN-134]|uniref:hypothetical protein n=1 Tax=Streptomyces sp. SLBN-134 TaxID=2768456 RepID=UPI0021B248B2|nr:hypothetical protein [Streptomyces sp. SLBN-134]
MGIVTQTPTVKASAERFTGDVYLNMIETPADPARLQGGVRGCGSRVGAGAHDSRRAQNLLYQSRSKVSD